MLLIAEKLFLLRFLEKTKVLKHLYVLLLVMISFLIFDAANLKDILPGVASLFGLTRLPAVSVESLYYLKSYAILLLAAAVFATPFPQRAVEWVRKRAVGRKITDAAEPLLLLSLLVACTAFLVNGSFNPFLYFRF